MAGASEVLTRLLKGAPISAMVQVTERCNYRCTHCYQSHATGEGELTFAEIESILDQLVDLGTLLLVLSGGEIFVRRDLEDILRAAHARSFATTLFTTGYFLDERRADLLYETGVHRVHLSLYGSHAAIHEAITEMPTSYERTTRAARLLRERGIDVILKTPLMRENLADVRGLAALADALGAKLQMSPTLSVTDRGDASPLRHRASDDELRAFYRERLASGLPALDKPVPEDATPCGAGQRALRIDSVGKVYACASLTRVAGDTRQTPLRDIWFGSTELARIRRVRWVDLEDCRACDLRRHCSRCHADAELEDGDLLGPSLMACRNALAMRDVLRERGELPATDVALPPPLARAAEIPDHRGLRLRVVA